MKPQAYKYYFKIIMIIIAVSGLLLTLVPSFLNWQGMTDPQHVNNLMLAGTILWFSSASFLFIQKKSE